MRNPIVAARSYDERLTDRLVYYSRFSPSSWSLGGNGGGGLGDMQVAVGVGQHDPLRRLAPSARNGKCGRRAHPAARP